MNAPVQHSGGDEDIGDSRAAPELVLDSQVIWYVFECPCGTAEGLGDGPRPCAQ